MKTESDKLNASLADLMAHTDALARKENQEWYEKQMESRRKYGYKVEPYNDDKNYVPSGASKYFGMPRLKKRN